MESHSVTRTLTPVKVLHFTQFIIHLPREMKDWVKVDFGSW